MTAARAVGAERVPKVQSELKILQEALAECAGRLADPTDYERDATRLSALIRTKAHIEGAWRSVKFALDALNDY
jgi:hypothetical protein